jgi:hypothetical protein
MSPITIKAPVELEPDDICESLSIGELVGLISYAANYFAEKKPGDFHDRRFAIEQIDDHLSENGRRFIGELAGCVYAKDRRKETTP